MTDIFVSYAHEDRERVILIVKELEKLRWSVFWDRNIPPGETWETFIGKALGECRCVLVVWSNCSVNSDWVKEEADEAKEKGRLVPLFLDAVLPPIGFRRIHAADLSDWKNNSSHQAFQELIGAIESKLSSSTLPSENGRDSVRRATQVSEPVLPKAEQGLVKKERSFSSGRLKTTSAIVAVVMFAVLVIVWFMSSKQESMPTGQASKAIAIPASIDAVKAKREAELRQKAEESRLKAEKEAADRLAAKERAKQAAADRLAAEERAKQEEADRLAAEAPIVIKQVAKKAAKKAPAKVASDSPSEAPVAPPAPLRVDRTSTYSVRPQFYNP